jgi:hypothetical protein
LGPSHLLLAAWFSLRSLGMELLRGMDMADMPLLQGDLVQSLVITPFIMYKIFSLAVRWCVLTGKFWKMQRAVLIMYVCF